MENASKALLIAGGMLLLILVLTFGIYLFTKIGNQTADLYEEIEQNDIYEFNQQFLNYDGKDNLTIQDVVSIINLAKDNNENGKLPVEVTVSLDGEDALNKDISELLLESDKDQYKCQVSYAKKPIADLVGSVSITKNK